MTKCSVHLARFALVSPTILDVGSACAGIEQRRFLNLTAGSPGVMQHPGATATATQPQPHSRSRRASLELRDRALEVLDRLAQQRRLDGARARGGRRLALTH